MDSLRDIRLCFEAIEHKKKLEQVDIIDLKLLKKYTKTILDEWYNQRCEKRRCFISKYEDKCEMCRHFALYDKIDERIKISLIGVKDVDSQQIN